MKLKHFALVAAASLGLIAGLVATTAQAHSGRTDSSGCHNNRKTGGYHCHNGGSSGQSSGGRSSTSSGSSPSPSSLSTSTPPQTLSDSGQTCSVTDSTQTIPSGEEHDYYQNLWVHGSKLQAKVSLLTQPGGEQAADAHSLIGNFVMASSRYFDGDCAAWIEVFDLSTGYTGWIAKNAIAQQPHQGYAAIPIGQGYR